MWKFVLLLVFDALVLQPLRCVIGFAIRFLWCPPQITPPRANNPINQTELFDRANALYQPLDRLKYGLDDDSAKFMGMLAYVRPGTEWGKLMRLVDDNGNLKRNLREPYPAYTPDFSTDMLSGFLLGVYGNLDRMTADERERLAKVWERASWEGFPMLLSSADRGKRLFGRGHVYRFWWICGSEEILMCLAWLALGHALTGKIKYKVAYRLMMILLSPSLLLTCPDAQIFVGRVYMLSAHNTHSRALVNFVGERITGSRWFRGALKVAYRRHGGYNADIRLLAAAGGAVPKKELNDEWSDYTLHLLASAAIKGTYDCPADRKYLALGLPPKIEALSGSFAPPESRGNDYVWERNPLKGYIYNDNQRAGQGLDVIFPAGLIYRVGAEYELR